jgi:hypothetical protein
MNLIMPLKTQLKLKIYGMYEVLHLNVEIKMLEIKEDNFKRFMKIILIIY